MIEWLWILGFAVLTISCGYGIWWILTNFIGAMYVGNIAMVLGFGILAYLFLGVLLIIFFYGIILLGTFVIEVLSDVLHSLSRNLKVKT